MEQLNYRYIITPTITNMTTSTGRKSSNNSDLITGAA